MSGLANIQPGVLTKLDKPNWLIGTHYVEQDWISPIFAASIRSWYAYHIYNRSSSRDRKNMKNHTYLLRVSKEMPWRWPLYRGGDKILWSWLRHYIPHTYQAYTPQKFQIGPKKEWLEDDFPLVHFQGRTIKLRGYIALLGLFLATVSQPFPLGLVMRQRSRL